ncbi:lipopolysaccharide biosynthesis protein [Streptomyces sp. MRC013]|uniref:lipopolysaccharide biosynthesis protein n=1 Tax=Streptomyces sp. MRC013 TaxID=2898276 RepID=UPI002025CA2C|nr:lipopolysaccharide biosynthesis protein [Streptomyces sp. MRC013]URM90313.1 lipopolysaccharide biosynthesis protein [Streptomyces sp. MRC013]
MIPRTLPVRRPLAGLARRAARAGRPGRAWTLPAAVLAGAVAGGAYGLLSTPEYAATSYVVVVPEERSDPAGAMGLAQAYGRVATDVALAQDAAVWARVSPATLRASVAAATSPDAPMISITARSDRPATAVAMADGVARALVQKGTHTEASTHVKVVPFSRATAPAGPVSPSAPLAALVGACGGGLLGGLFLLVRPERDTAPGGIGTGGSAAGGTGTGGSAGRAPAAGPAAGAAGRGTAVPGPAVGDASQAGTA